MSDVLTLDRPQTHSRFYYGWLNLFIAALAMVVTLPGRTQGLGLITEPLLRDLNVTHWNYATYNAWATLLGATFGLLLGPLTDRLGVRTLLTLVLLCLAATVLYMARITTHGQLLATLILTRGFGQTALSAVSLTIVGKWFVRRLPIAMALYSVLISIGFIIAFSVVGYVAIHAGWRAIWMDIGWAIALLAVIGVAIVRATPESIGLTVDGAPPHNSTSQHPAETGLSLPEALRTFAFWIFALSASIFALVSTGLMLFNEAVLVERGFPKEMMITVIGIITLMGLVANFAGGYLADRWPIGRLMGVAMFFLAASLCLLPLAHGNLMAYTYAVAMGIAGGIVMVVFFVCWARVFGRKHLGAIQGAAQVLTVLGSAAGPIALQFSIKQTGSSVPLLLGLAPLVVLMGIACWISPMPSTT